MIIFKKRFIVLIAVVIFLFAFLAFQDNSITVTNYEYSSNKIGKEFDEYKIVQISDLHTKEFGKNNKRLLNKIKKQNPDIIVITGDIIQSFNNKSDIAIKFVENASKIASVYYVTGNHEKRLSETEQSELFVGLKNAGANILENQTVEITRGANSFYLIGLDDNNRNDETLNKITSTLDKSKLQILLSHQPDYFENYSNAGMDIVFCGHIHGGQIRLPFFGGLLSPDKKFFPKYYQGEYYLKSSTMIVSRGLGNSILPFRIFNRPEIVTMTLKASK